MRFRALFGGPGIFVAFCIVAVIAAASRASAAEGQDKPTEWASASVASLNKLSAVAAEIGAELPPFLTAKGIGEQFPFLGADGVDPDRPIGLVVLARGGWDVGKGQGVVFVLPAKADAAPLSGFTKAGATPVEGHADTVSLNGVAFRRTTDDLIFSPSVDAATAVDPAAMAAGFAAQAGGLGAAGPAGDGAVVRVVVDIAALRAGQPEAFKRFLDGVRQNTAPAQNEGQRAGQDLAFNLMASLNRLDLTLARRAHDLELALGVWPMAVPPAGTLPKPGMPAGVVGRYDVAAAPMKLYPSIDDLVKQFARAAASNSGTPMTDDQKRQVESWFHDVFNLALGGQGLSVGLEPQGNGFVVYMVQQQPDDFEARAKKLADEFNSISEALDKPGQRSTISVDHYTLDGGGAVTRLTMRDKDKPQGYLDVAVRGGQAFIAFAEDPAHHIEGLVNAPAAGQMDGLFRGESDLQKLVAAMKAAPGSPLSQLPADRVAALERAVNGRTFVLRADAAGEGLAIRMALPPDLIKLLTDLLRGN